MSLYSMLPEAREYLKKGGFDDQPAGFLMMGCFVGGFVGIQFLSRVMHRFLPSHVVDCDHTHGEPNSEEAHGHTNGDGHEQSLDPAKPAQHGHHHHHASEQANGNATESTPLLSAETRNGHAHGARRTVSGVSDPGADRTPRRGRSRAGTAERRPSMAQLPRRVMSFVVDTKDDCDERGSCKGYTDPCGQECFKHLSTRSSTFGLSRAPTMMHTTTQTFPHSQVGIVEEDAHREDAHSPAPERRTSRARSRSCEPRPEGESIQGSHDDDGSEYGEDLEAQHHHHVPENAFLSIGLQTSIAIALHKLPEGFITYATNHANPSLGFNVFLALFVHNISEGFAMALPLYMALHSRWKAMLWSFILGGLSQPLGAGIAVLWLKTSKHTHMSPDDVAYGCLFAATAGIMASVALQLFVESLSLNHNRNLSILFAFLGMAVLGFSNAFTSHEH